MAASTITRATWTNDTGSAASPNLDGTILNNTRLQNDVYAKIDEMFAGAGAYATFTLGGKIAVEGFGTHSFSAGGTGGNNINLRNTTAGTGNYSSLNLGNDATASLLAIYALSSTFTTAANLVANGVDVEATGAGGLSVAATHASGVIRFYAGGTTEKTEIYGTASESRITILGGAFGTGSVTGGLLVISRNSSGGGAPGIINLERKDGTAVYIYSDTSAVLRIGSAPTETTGDTGGTIVGTQTSTRASKNIAHELRDTRAALKRIINSPVFAFRYKNGAYNQTQFRGITTDDSPQYGMDDGRSFNPVSAFGDTVLALKEIVKRINRLEAA